MAGAVTEELEDWPEPPEPVDLGMAASPWEVLRAYAETRFLADVLHGDIELYLGPAKKLRSTWDRAVRLQRRLELSRSVLPPSQITAYPGPAPGAAITRADVARAAGASDIFTRQITDEINDLYGVGAAHPADPLTISVGAARAAVDCLGVLGTAARYLLDADTVARRVSPKTSLIDPLDQERLNALLGPLRPIAEEVRRRREREQVEADLRRRDDGAAWVLAADYAQFTAWCLDHGVDHLNKRLVAFPSKLLWQHWLQGRTGLRYALGYGWERREDRGEFLDFMNQRGAEEWRPPKRGEGDVHGA